MQALLEHRACLCQDGLRILGRMELKPLHVPVLILQAVTDLQEGAVHSRIIQGTANLQCLLDVPFQPLPGLIGYCLSSIGQRGHFLDTYLGKLHQTGDFLFGVIPELEAKVFTPHLHGVERFVGKVVLGCVDRCPTSE